MQGKANRLKTHKPIRALVAASFVLACAGALVCGTAMQAFAAVGFETSNDLGIYVGNKFQEDKDAGASDEGTVDNEHFKDPNTVGANIGVEVGIYVGSAVGDGVSGEGTVDNEHFKDPNTVGADVNVDLGIYVGNSASETDGDFAGEGAYDSATGTADFGADLGIYVGKSTPESEGSFAGTTTVNPNDYSLTVDRNVELGIYVGNSIEDGEANEFTDTTDSGEVTAKSELGIYVGNVRDDSEEQPPVVVDPDDYSLSVDRDVELGIYVGTTENEATTDPDDPASASASTTLAIRMVDPETSPDVTEEGYANVTWCLGDADDPTWADGNTNNVSERYAVEGSETTIDDITTIVPGGKSKNPTATNQKFNHWLVEDNTDSTSVDVPATEGGSSSVTLKNKHSYTITAQWKNNDYTVTLDPGIGTITGSDTWTVDAANKATGAFEYGSSLALPEFPAVYKDGYMFDGWYTEEPTVDGDNYVGAGDKVSAVDASQYEAGTFAKTLYAAWTKTIEYPEPGPDNPDPEPVPVEGYVYVKFVTGFEGGDPALSVPVVSLKENTVMPASYLPGFESGKTTYTSSDGTKKYQFEYWTTDGVNKVDVNTTNPITESITYIAKWKNLNGHTVAFNKNGETAKWADETMTGETFTLPDPIEDGKGIPAASVPGVQNDGHIFAGWYTDTTTDDDTITFGDRWKFSEGTEGGEGYIAGTPVTDDITLYARWISVMNVDVPVEAHIQLVHTGTDESGKDAFVVNAKTYGKFRNQSDLDIAIVDVSESNATEYASTYSENAKNVLGEDNYSKAYLTILAKENDSASTDGITEEKSADASYADGSPANYKNNDGSTERIKATAYQVSTDMTKFEDKGWVIYKYQLNQLSGGSDSPSSFLTSYKNKAMVIPKAEKVGGKTQAGSLQVYYGVTFDDDFNIDSANWESELKQISSLKYTVAVSHSDEGK